MQRWEVILKTKCLICCVPGNFLFPGLQLASIQLACQWGWHWLMGDNGQGLLDSHGAGRPFQLGILGSFQGLCCKTPVFPTGFLDSL